MLTSWLFLAGAIALEVMGTTAMKFSEGLTKPVPSVLLFVFYALSFGLFALALKQLQVGLSYAIWSGIGTAAITLIGFFFFEEPLNTVKILAIGLIMIGVVVLNLSDPSHV